MDTHSIARPGQDTPKDETVVHAGTTHSHATRPSTTTTSSTSTTTTASTAPAGTKTSSSTRPAGFVRTPSSALPSFSTKLEPEGSSLGRYITIGAIVILVILLIFQIASKGGLRGQIRVLESDNKELTEQVASLQAELARTPTAPTSNAPAPGSTTGSTTTGTLSLMTYPVLFRENNFQKIAQTISVSSNAKIGGVYLRGVAGKGSAGQVAIYESPNFGRLANTKPLVKRSFDTSKIPADQPFSVKFDKPIELKTGVGYLLVVETTKKDASAEIAYRSATSSAPGTMWVYSRKLAEAGTVLSSEFSWQEIPGYDLFFELRGAE